MISDTELKEAAFEADRAMLDALPEPEECDHVFSADFERKMHKLIRRVRHPILYKGLQRAACVLIVFVLSAGLFLTFHAEARAAVVDWIRERIGDFYRYSPGEKNPDAATASEYCLGWIPEGYTLLFSHNTGSDKTECYMNESGNLIQFHCLHNSSAGSLTVGGGEHVERYTVIKDMEAIIHLAKNSTDHNSITCYANSGEYLIYIAAHLDEADLIKIAENIYLQGKLND